MGRPCDWSCRDHPPNPNTVELAVRYVWNRVSNYSPLTKGGNSVRLNNCSWTKIVDVEGRLK